jgi:hypothetical protein
VILLCPSIDTQSNVDEVITFSSPRFLNVCVININTGFWILVTQMKKYKLTSTTIMSSPSLSYFVGKGSKLELPEPLTCSRMMVIFQIMGSPSWPNVRYLIRF